MRRDTEVEELYKELTTLVRRSRELSADLHPGLSLVAYTFLSQIQLQPGTRAADLAERFGLDKSTVSRQVDQLATSDLLVRRGEQPGQRGQTLELTALGEAALDTAAESVKAALVAWLSDWNDGEIADFAHMVARFNMNAQPPVRAQIRQPDEPGPSEPL